MIGKRVRHLQRYREIMNALIRNGFSYVVKDLGLFEMFSTKGRWSAEKKEIRERSRGEQIRFMFEELGPSFVKLGQFASTRPDIFPIEIIEELEKLQADVAPFSLEEIEEIIATELGKKPSEVFLQFEEKPLAAASIGQVHRAVLHNEREVIIKVQRPNIHQQIATDLEIITDLARLAESRFEWAESYHLCDLVYEFGESIHKELDYEKEGRNADRMARNCAGDETVVIPEIYWDYTTKKVITMDFVRGIAINDVEKIKERQLDPTAIARQFTDILLEQILMDGYFHGDPHPGNVLIMEDGKIALIDFGMMGTLHPQLKYEFASLVLALDKQDTDKIIRAISQMDLIPHDVDRKKLHTDVDEFREKYAHKELGKLKLGEALNELFTIAHAHKIQFPGSFTMLGKAILTMEGIIETLDPKINIMELAEPFGQRIIRDRFHPKNMTERFWSHTVEIADEIVKLPKNLRELMNTIKRGEIQHNVKVTQLDVLLRKIDSVANRLSYSIVILSFSIIMFALIIGISLGEESAFFFHLPIVEIGFVIATLMVGWLLYSIYKSGKWF